MTMHEVETVVVGAGQCGLAAGYHLAQRGRSFVILDEHPRVGDNWRERWDSLRLYGPARYDSLPGMAFPGLGPHDFPSGRQMGDYLESYATFMELPVRTGVSVDRVLPDGENGYTVTAGAQRWRTSNVVVASGGQQVPTLPIWAGDLGPGIRQLHSADYRRPDQLADGPVLVVGASHSGADIALEAAQAGHDVVLSGPHHGELPVDIEGPLARVMLPLIWFGWRNVLNVSNPIGRKMAPEVRAHGGPLIRVKSAHLEAAGVDRVLARTAGVEQGRPMLDDGRVLDVSNVVWCTGFHVDFSWVDVPVFDADGNPRQECGVTAATGLYFLGLIFQRSFSSMLVGGASRDAAFVAKHIVKRQQRRALQPV